MAFFQCAKRAYERFYSVNNVNVFSLPPLPISRPNCATHNYIPPPSLILHRHERDPRNGLHNAGRSDFAPLPLIQPSLNSPFPKVNSPQCRPDVGLPRKRSSKER